MLVAHIRPGGRLVTLVPRGTRKTPVAGRRSCGGGGQGKLLHADAENVEAERESRRWCKEVFLPF